MIQMIWKLSSADRLSIAVVRNVTVSEGKSLQHLLDDARETRWPEKKEIEIKKPATARESTLIITPDPAWGIKL